MSKVRDEPDATDVTVGYGVPVGERRATLNAPAQSLVHEAADVRRTSQPTARRSFCDAVRTIGPAGRCAAALVTVTAMLSLLHDRVPAASAVAVAMLVTAAVVDAVEHRLPNSLVAAAGVTWLVVLAVEIAVSTTTVIATDVVLGIALFAGPLLLMHLVSPAAMGFGDVKVALVLGAATGAVHWQLAVVALTLAAGGTAAIAVGRRVPHIAFGPGLIAAAVVSLAAHPLLLTAEALDTALTIGRLA